MKPLTLRPSFFTDRKPFRLSGQKPPVSGSNAFEWRRSEAYQAPETTFVPLDDFLQVQLLSRDDLRNTIRDFLEDHCPSERGISFIASRGKLTAQFVPIGEQRASFGEVVKTAQEAIAHSEAAAIRKLDARELARSVCLPAVSVR